MAQRFTKISDDDALKLVKSRVDLQGRNAYRAPMERVCATSFLYFIGRQHLYRDDTTGRYRDRSPNSLRGNRELYKANLALPNVMRAVLTVNGANAEFAVAPKKNTRQANRAAWTSTKLFEHLSDASGFESKKDTATMLAAICGSSFWKVGWDPDRGEPSRFFRREEGGVWADPPAAERKRLEDAGKFDDINPGDVFADVLSYFEVWADPRAREEGFDEKCRWAAHVSVTDRDAIRAEYGDQIAEKVAVEDPSSGALYYQEMLANVTSSGMTGFRQKDDYKIEHVVKVELWERRSNSNGMAGRKVVVAGGVVIENRDNPYRLLGLDLPFVKQDWIKCPGRFLGIGLMEQIRNSQYRYNEARGKMTEHQNVYGSPATFVQKGSGIPIGHMVIEPGVTYETTIPPASAVKTMEPPHLPPEVAANASVAKNEIGEISSTQSIEESKLPGQIRGAPGIQLILDERNKLLSHPAENFVRTKVAVGQRLLRNARQFYGAERVVHYVGEDRKLRVLAFLASDIDADLRVSIDRAKLLASPTAARAQIIEAGQTGVLNPAMNPDDRETVLRALDVGSADTLYADRLQEEENQEREIEEMLADPVKWIEPRVDMMAGAGAEQTQQGYPLNPFDDDQAHVRVLMRFMRSEEYRSLDPVSASLLLVHLQAHQGRIQEAQIQQLMLQQAMQGAPAERGTPSAPKHQAV